MNRRKFIKKFTTAAASIILFNHLLCAKTKNKPNIILIVADDLGYGELGCYGQQKIKTPNIDKLATEGVKFINFYAGSPVCAPSRCVLMTGKHGGHAYVRDNYEVGTWESFQGQLPLPDKEITIAELLKRAGYKTGAFGKWGLGRVNSSGDPLNQGFDTFFGYNCQRHAHNYYPKYLIHNKEKIFLDGNNRSKTGKHYAPKLIADKAIEFIKENRNNPFFLYYPTIIPHLPLQVPEDEKKQYLGKWEEKPYNGKAYLPDKTPRATYAAMISFLDKNVGRIMETLQKLNLDENTIIIFTSDNGTTYLKDEVDYEFFNSTKGLKGLKGSVYEGGLKVPLIVRWKGKIKEGRIINNPFAFYDIMPTIADIAGIKIPQNIDGLSFLPLLAGNKNKQKFHEFLFWDFAGYGGQIAVRYGKYKGILKNLKKNPDAKLELYDLEQDPYEKNNIANQHPDIVNKIMEIIKKERTKPEIKKFRFWKYYQ